MTEKLFVIRKGGYYYRPHAQGYTASLHEAGRYPEAEAMAHMEASDPGEITIFLAPLVSTTATLTPDIAAAAERIVLEHCVGSFDASNMGEGHMERLAAAIAAALEAERARNGTPAPTHISVGGRWRIFEDTTPGYWGIELENAGNDDDPIMYPIKIHRERVAIVVDAHNAEVARLESLHRSEIADMAERFRAVNVSEAVRQLSDILPAAPAEHVASFQDRVQPWMMACFGAEISADRLERNDRFIEEALELVQASDYPRERALALVDYVYGRDQGEINQEVGGVMVTLAAHCLAHGVDMHEAAETELARIWTKVDVIRAKQKAKPTGSALPVAISASEVEG